MTTKGYIILAQNSKDDYIRMAYALALSIKNTQSVVNSVTLLTDVVDAVPDHYKEVFDNVIQIPWFDDALTSEWKIENRWKIYHVTPYDETVLLDADMLFLSDVSHWWNYLSKHHDLMITDKVFTYRNELITGRFYRKTFDENKLPNIYSAFTYFKKSSLAEEFWNNVEIVTKDWQMFYNKFLLESKPKHLSIDVVFAIVVKVMGIEDHIISHFDFPRFTHMKSRIQNWRNSTEDWTDYLSSHFNRPLTLKVGTYNQTGIFHYTEKKFLNDHILYVLEDFYKEKINGSI